MVVVPNLTRELVCIECGARADERATRWQAFLIDLDDDGQDELVFYCPACAAREFQAK